MYMELKEKEDSYKFCCYRRITKENNFQLYLLGSRGYMPLEYLKTEMVTTKINVYDFKVLLLEFITGKDFVTLQDRRKG